jgi:hypothetical protein
MLKTLVIGGAAALLVAAPAAAEQSQRDQARSGRAAQTSTTNVQGQKNANENAGFDSSGQTGGGQSGGMSGDHRGHNMSGGQTGGETGGQLTEGMPIVDGSGKTIGTITQVQRTQSGEIRMVKVRFDGFGRVMIKLVPVFQLKVQGTKALTQLVQAEIEKLQNG